MKNFIITFLPGIITAVLASYLAARWSLRQIYAEKWWERKERAYSDIIASLYDIMQYFEYQSEHAESGYKLSEEREREMEAKYDDAKLKLDKVTDIGGFVISKDAADLLKALRERHQSDRNESAPIAPWDEYYIDFKAHKEVLDKIVRIANRDLKKSKS